MAVKTIDRAFVLPIVEKLARLHKGTAVMNTECLGGGSFGIIYKVDFEDYERRIIKVYKTDGKIHTEERLALDELRKACRVRVPHVFFIHNETEEIPFDALGMEYIDGISLDRLKFVSPVKKRKIADAVTTEIAYLHGTKGDRFGYLDNAIFTSWTSFYGIFVEDCLKAAKTLEESGDLDEYIVKLLQTGNMKMDYIFKEKVETPALVHGDINPHNIIVDRKNKSLMAFIDPSGTMWGDPEYDLFPLKSTGGGRYKLYETYKKNNPTTEFVDLKTAFYALANEIRVAGASGVIRPERILKLGKTLERQFKLHGLR